MRANPLRPRLPRRPAAPLRERFSMKDEAALARRAEDRPAVERAGVARKEDRADVAKTGLTEQLFQGRQKDEDAYVPGVIRAGRHKAKLEALEGLAGIFKAH